MSVKFTKNADGTTTIRIQKTAEVYDATDAALYVDRPLDPDEWIERIGKLLEDSELRNDLIGRGRKLLPKYSRGEFAKNLSRFYFPPV